MNINRSPLTSLGDVIGVDRKSGPFLENFYFSFRLGRDLFEQDTTTSFVKEMVIALCFPFSLLRCKIKEEKWLSDTPPPKIPFLPPSFFPFRHRDDVYILLSLSWVCSFVPFLSTHRDR